MPRKKASPENQTELLTRKEAATYLGVSEQTLAVWHCTKRYNLPVVKVGRLAKYRRIDLERFVNGEAIPEVSVPKPESMAMGFAEVRVVEERTVQTQEAPAISAPLEISLPSGVKLRVDAGCSMQLLASVVQILENR